MIKGKRVNLARDFGKDILAFVSKPDILARKGENSDGPSLISIMSLSNCVFKMLTFKRIEVPVGCVMVYIQSILFG